MMRCRLLVLAVVLASAATACIGRGGSSRIYLVAAVSGSAEVRTEGGWRSLGKGDTLGPGDSVRVVGGSIVLERSQSNVELRPSGETAPAEMQVLSPGELEVVSGDMLVRSDPGTPVSVSTPGVQARADSGPGTFRFDRRNSIRIGVYEGAATVEAASGTLPLPPLRESVIAGRVLLSPEPEPLRVRVDDPWDKTLLADVIELNVQLETQARGYEGEFGARTETVAELQPIAPNRDLSFVRPFLRTEPAADVLFGVVFALLAEREGRGDAAQVFGDAVRLLERGATWGLLAREYGIDDLLGGVVRAIGSRTGEVEPGNVVPPSDGDGDGGPAPEPEPTDDPDPTPTPTRTRPPSPTPTPTRTSPGPPSPSPTCDIVNDTLGNC